MKGLIYKVFRYFFQKSVRKRVASYFRKRWESGKVNSRKINIKPAFLFTPVPILNNKYWAYALRKGGYKAHTLMSANYSITEDKDFDLYFIDIKSKYASGLIYRILNTLELGQDYLYYKMFEWAVTNYNIFCQPFTGGILSFTVLKNEEAQLLHSCDCKIVTLAYGSDYFQYSRVLDPSYRHAIIACYPEMAKREFTVHENYRYWAEHADFVMGSMAHDGLGRWDMLPVNSITIDTTLWNTRTEYSNADGYTGEVIISHSPNHRYVKGTEYILKAIKDLQLKGLKIKLLLIENKTNAEVRAILEKNVDIHIEQVIYCGYALSAIEGMACGLPVISNEENELTTRVLRRYSYLDECPVLSSSPEKIEESLTILVRNPNLRKVLGLAGRAYVEKYHSERSAQNMFGKIAEKIWEGKNLDLMSEFHPIMENSYNNRSPKIVHPLIENKISEEFRKTLIT